MDNDDYIKKLEEEMNEVYHQITCAKSELHSVRYFSACREYYADLDYTNAKKRIKDEYYWGLIYGRPGSFKEKRQKYKEAMDDLKTRGRDIVQNEKKAARDDVRKAEDRLNALKEEYASLQAEYEVAIKEKK